MAKNNSFRHESLQDREMIGKYLRTLTKAVENGSVVLEDDDGSLTLTPDGLINFKVTGSQEDNQNRINIRLSWQSSPSSTKKKTLKIS